MEVKYQIKKDCLIVFLNNEIDHHTSMSLRTSIDSLISSSDVTELLLDFTEVNFIDSSGIGLILGRYKKIKKRGGNMQIINTNRQIKKILHMASIETLMPVY